LALLIGLGQGQRSSESLVTRSLIIQDSRGFPRFVLQGGNHDGPAEFEVRDGEGRKRISIRTVESGETSGGEVWWYDQNGRGRVTIGSTDEYVGALFADGLGTARLVIAASDDGATVIAAHSADGTPIKSFP
jgi:hypothetical protein